MSTRANIIVKDTYSKLFFYRHSDGYPEGTLPTLNIFMKWLKEGKIRDNVGQSAGWLIMLGAMEYGTVPAHEVKTTEYMKGYFSKDCDITTIQAPTDWKVGAYEPTDDIHGDIEFLYIIDLQSKEVKCYDSWTDKGEGKHEVEIPEKLQLA